MRRFFINHTIKGKYAIITGHDVNHIRNVLRLNPGDKIGLFDGQGLEYEAEIIEISPSCIRVLIVNSFRFEPKSRIRITIAQAMLKNRKADILVRQLTELGMTRWMPFFAERAIPRPDLKRINKRFERWKKIGQEASKQCGRSCVPIINKPVSFDELIDISKEYDLTILFWEKQTSGLELMTKKDIKKIMIVIGPEGGFTDKEIKQAENAGILSHSLGPRILRVETASLAACTLIQYIFGDMKKNP
ncbi:Ribosomal RNA small subunit methyltransferase E [Candidatus Magnetomoraceae bacterium gMMP-15]